MQYDLSKLHPIHQESFKDFLITEYANALTPDGRLAKDVMYERYLEVNQKVPEIIGKTKLTKTEKTKVKTIQDAWSLEDKQNQNRVA